MDLHVEIFEPYYTLRTNGITKSKASNTQVNLSYIEKINFYLFYNLLRNNKVICLEST